MPKTVDNYIIGKLLFKDTFTIQYFSCQHKIIKKNFTLKKIDRPSQNDTDSNQNSIMASYACSCFQNEISISRQVRSQRVIKCLKLLKSKHSIFAVFDQHPEKTLQNILMTQYLTFEKKQAILSEILKLVLQLHEANITIGNLNPKHIFVTEQNQIQISNFLIARKLQDDETVQIDKYFIDPNCSYFAPQLIKTGKLSKAADIYTLGQIMKALKIQKSQQQLSSSIRPFLESIRNYIDKMTYEDPSKRPSIFELTNSLRQNKIRKISLKSKQSKDFDQKSTQSKSYGLQNCKSNISLRNFVDQNKSPISNEQKKTLLLKRKDSLNQNLFQTQKKINLRTRTTLQVDTLNKKSVKDLLEVPTNRNSRELNSPLSSKSIISSSQTDDSKRILTKKEKIEEIILLRSTVSFILQMTQFIYEESKSKVLTYLMIEQGLNNTQNSMKIIESMIQEEQDVLEFLQFFFQECKNERKKILQIMNFFTEGSEFKKYDQLMYGQQLRKFGRFVLSSYLTQNSLFSKSAQLTDSLTKSNLKFNDKKHRKSQQKLFKALLVLKRVQYGSYFDFLKAKVHHFDKNFRSQHYFEFERNFGAKYFVIQIKDLINRK